MVVRKRETHTETNQRRNTVHKCRQSACIGIHIQSQLRQIRWRKKWSTNPADWCGSGADEASRGGPKGFGNGSRDERDKYDMRDAQVVLDKKRAGPQRDRQICP